MKSDFENTGKLFRFLAKRERVGSSIWIIALTAFSVILAPMLANMFDEPAREALILTVNNPAMISMLGPIYGIDNYTQGAMYFNMMVQWMMIAAAVMNILFVVRHTRSDEEHGRIDMLRSLSVGKFAGLCSVMLAAFVLNLVIALFTGIGIAVCGVESMDLNGALLYGASIGAAGFVFAAAAAVFSQLSATSRGASGLAIVLLGFMYLLRGAGDVGNEMFSYISPLGLAQRTKAFVENNYFPILILIAEAIVLTLWAFFLNGHRDVRQGYFPVRRGKEHAKAYLSSPFGLAFRLLMMPLFCWTVGMFIIGAAYGSILGTIDNFVQSSEFYAMVIGSNPNFSTEQMFASMVTAEMSLCSVFPVLTMILKVRSEEKDGYYQNVLSNAVSKYRYLTGYVLLAFAEGVLVQFASALGIFASAVAVLPKKGILTLGYLLKANMVYVPALWVMVGIAVLLIGIAPRKTAFIWVYFGFSFIVTFMGRMPDAIPKWVVRLSPFGWVPNLPVDDIHYDTLLLMTAMALVMTLLGVISYRNRDITTA